MNKNDNIHIRIELCKDGDSGDITLMTYFDTNAPNFSQDDKGFYWLPTPDEKNFLNEVFELFPEFQMKSPSLNKTLSEPLKHTDENPVFNELPVDMESKEPEKTMTDPLEKKEEPVTNYPPQTDMERKELEKTITDPLEKKETLTPPPSQANMEQRESETPSSPFEKQERKYPIDNIPPFQKKEETNPEMNQDTSNTNDDIREQIKDEQKKEFVEADDQDIDKALEKGEDKSMIEADEDTIVERVLSQKQKGKWTRER